MEEKSSRQWAAHAVIVLRAVDLFARPQGVSNEELVSELGIGLRTVFRVKRAIEDLGFPVAELDSLGQRKKRYALQADYVKKLPNITVPDLHLSLSEVLALALLRGRSAIFRGTAIESGLASAFAKLEALLPAATPQRLAGLQALLLPNTRFAKDYSAKGPILDTLVQGMVRRHSCDVEYHSFDSDQVKGYSIDPLHLFEQDGGLYLFARITRYGDIRVLAVERIQSIRLSEATFIFPDGFNATALLENSFTLFLGEPVTVRVRFAAGQARYVMERRWAKEQSVATSDDGSVILTLKASGWWDIKRWILSFGGGAEVLEPEKLRRQVAKELQAAAARY